MRTRDRNLYVNQLVMVTRDDDATLKPPVEASVISMNSNAVWIKSSRPQMALEGFVKGMKVTLSVGDETGVHLFHTRVQQVNGEFVAVDVPVSSVVVQRRRNFRANFKAPVWVTTVTSTHPRALIGVPEEWTIIDLSGGGMQIGHNRSLHVNDVIDLSFALPQPPGPPKTISVRATVRRTFEAIGSKLPYRMGVEFMELPERDQDLVVNYLFTLQRKLRSPD